MALHPSADAVLTRARSATLTYPEIGATAEEEMPTGYRQVRREWVVGRGSDAFDRATRGLRHWEMHRRAGLTVRPSAPAAERDVVVVLGVGVAPLRLFAPCRVVYDVLEQRRRGFAYGTLPGHPESGEEMFVVEHRRDDAVVLRVAAFSRPGTRCARLAGPLSRVLQNVITRRYAEALREAATSA